MTEVLSDRLRRCYTGVVHDVMRAMGLRDFTLPHELTPILPEQAMAGPAFTIDGKTDPRADANQTLLEWTGLLSKIPSGHVWVCQPNDSTVAHMGELSAETLKNKGVLGCVLDGGARDVNFLLDIGFQTWRRYNTPRDIVGYWLPRAIEVEIRIGDVLINPGDYMVGDRDGLIRVPKAIVADVITQSEIAIGTENQIRTAILAGQDPQAAYLQFGKF